MARRGASAPRSLGEPTSAGAPGARVARRSTRKRSPVATPGTQAISSPESTTGVQRAALARDLAVGEQVLQRAAAAEAERAHAVAGPPGADVERRRERGGVERGASGSSPSGRSAPRSLVSSPPAGGAAGDRERGRRAGAAAARPRSNRSRPYSTTARRPPPTSSAALPPPAPSARISSVRGPTAGGRPAGAVGEPLHREPRERRRQRGEPRDLLRRSPRAPRRRPSRAPPPRRAGRRASRSTLASAAGCTVRSASSRPWRMRLRANASRRRCVGSSRQVSPRARQ